MAKFKFRLASVLRLREHIKKEKQWELRSLYDTRREIMAELDALEKELVECGAILMDGQILTVRELQLSAEYGQTLARLIKAKRLSLAKLNDTIDEKRDELVEAMRAAKSLEQLRQRHEQRFWRAENTAQQRSNDEMAQRKYVQPGSRKKVPI
jgi:flagellar export protein FliJ